MKEEFDGFRVNMKEEMEKDARQIEDAIRADAEISNMKASAELKDKVQKRIAEYQREELLARLSEEDREALRLGQELQKKRADGVSDAEHSVEISDEIGISSEEVMQAAGKTSLPRRGRKILWKRVAVLAAAIVAVLAIGITSVGGPRRFIEEMKQTVGGREMTRINSDDEEVLGSGEDIEEKSYQQAKDELGFDPVKIIWKPEKMTFDRVEIDPDIPLAHFIYELDGQTITYVVDALYIDNSWGLDVEDELVEEYEYPLEKTTASVEAYKISDTLVNYLAQFDYQDVHYTLIGVMEKEELESILENLHFL